MVDALKTHLQPISVAQKLLMVIFLAVVAIPLIPLPGSPKLFSPVNTQFRWAMIGAGVALSQAIWWKLFTPRPWKPGHLSLKILIGALSIFFSALFGTLFGLRAAPLYSFYELQHLDHDQREMLYVVESVSAAGRGGFHAYVNPYGFGRWGLPVSRPDYDAFRHAKILPTGLICYRVTEVRRGNVIGILRPSERRAPSNALVPCEENDRRLVMNVTDYRSNWK